MSRSVDVYGCALATMLATVISLSAQQSSSLDSDPELATLLAEAQKTFVDRDWDRGVAAYQTLLTTARERGSELWQGRATLGLGRIANERAQYADARRHAGEALEIFERLNATNDIGDANRTLGLAAQSVNNE